MSLFQTGTYCYVAIYNYCLNPLLFRGICNVDGRLFITDPPFLRVWLEIHQLFMPLKNQLLVSLIISLSENPYSNNYLYYLLCSINLGSFFPHLLAGCLSVAWYPWWVQFQLGRFVSLFSRLRIRTKCFWTSSVTSWLFRRALLSLPFSFDSGWMQRRPYHDSEAQCSVLEHLRCAWEACVAAVGRETECSVCIC